MYAELMTTKKVKSMSKTVCLDAGHYKGYNPYPAAKGYYEGNQMWKLANYLKPALERCGVKVVMTKTSLEANPGLTTRGATAGRNKADLFISLHSNAVSNAVNDKVTGVECYYSIFDNNGKAIATNLCNTVAAVMNTANRGAKIRRGSGNWDYYSVIKGAVDSGCKTAFLIEHGFHTSHHDAAFLIVDSNLKKLAEAEAKAICAWLGVAFKEEATVTKPATSASSAAVPSGSFLVRVKDDDLNIRSGPGTQYKVVGQIRDHGTYTITKTVGKPVGQPGSWGKLKSGVGYISLNQKYVEVKK